MTVPELFTKTTLVQPCRIIAIVSSPGTWLVPGSRIFIQQNLAKRVQFKRVQLASARVYLGFELTQLSRRRPAKVSIVLALICAKPFRGAAARCSVQTCFEKERFPISR